MIPIGSVCEDRKGDCWLLIQWIIEGRMSREAIIHKMGVSIGPPLRKYKIQSQFAGSFPLLLWLFPASMGIWWSSGGR
jgi:hypothetical protein